MSNKEYRSADVEFREEQDSLILEGYAVVWNSKTLIGSETRGFYESISPEAIDEKALKDVPLKYNHESGTFILARNRNKSLELIKDEHGLFIRAKLQPNVQQHVDVYNMVKSGLLDKMSFAFTIADSIIDRSGNLPYRKVTKIDKLFDVSIVDIPAYNDTDVYARSLELVETELRALEKEEEKQALDDVELLKLKYRIKLGLTEKQS